MKEYNRKLLSEVLETKCFHTFLVEGPYCVTKVKKEAVIKLEDAIENTLSVIKVSKGEKFSLLVDTREIKSIEKEARDHFSMRNRQGHVNAIAVLIGSPVSVVVGNFFMGLNKPAVPTKLFTTPEKAFNWMDKF